MKIRITKCANTPSNVGKEFDVASLVGVTIKAEDGSWYTYNSEKNTELLQSWAFELVEETKTLTECLADLKRVIG